MVAKINVSLPEDVLAELDVAGREAHASRSAFLLQAIRRFLEEKAEERKREKRRQAAATMDRLREEFGDWDGTAEIIRWRDMH